ncbi:MULTISPECIES: sialidase family protein [Methylomonas]|uniref:exo-alpha-sialidase n=2 Tax=Methylomonas TaxID=416 RepID=A0A126T339_9GAMM|nr:MULTISPECIES: sialidase family protein [Methylomonas]AMK76489.1 sialidase [Methylomonas denitrificans]OAH98796.1 sialidase [Methylomonas methanica]TCV88522.1 BNR repeat protein [Methylomonas methanica]
MPNFKARFLGGCLAVALALFGCGEQTFESVSTAQALRANVLSPIDAKALGLQNLVSFDVYVDRQTVHAVFVATPTGSKQPYIGYLHSEDGGLHWSLPRTLSQQFNQSVEAKIGNDIQIAAAGDKLLVVWQTTGELPGMGPLLTVYSNDAGKTWQQGAKPTGSDADQSHHELLADSEGRFHAVWLDDRDENGYQGVRYARSSDVGKSWELAQTIDDSSCSCCWNRLTLGGDGKLSALYRDMKPRDMALAQTADGGASWQRLSTVGEFNWIFDGCPHNGGGLTVAGDGSLHSLVWTGAENQVGLYHMQSTDNGKSWTPPQRLGEAGAFHSDIAFGVGRLVAVWDALGPEGSKVFISESVDNGGHWSVAKPLSWSGGSATFPRIVATPTGLLAMWLEQAAAGKQWAAAVLQ